MDIHQLKIFVSVYRHNSFTRASEQMNISQPTISEHIKNLEKELGCSLFDRLGRSILPTSQAEFLYPRALKIIGDFEKITHDINRVGDSVRGEIVIGASTIPGTYILPKLAVLFKKQYPEVSFEILIDDSANITEKVLAHELFCGVIGARMESRKLIYDPVVEDELVLVATKETFPKRTMGMDELHAVPFLMRENGSGTRRIMENRLEVAGLRPEGIQAAAVLGSTAAVREAVKEGLGVSILSRLAVREELKSGLLHEINLPGVSMKRHFFLIGHQKKTLPHQYQVFCDFLKKHEFEGAGAGQ